MREPEKYTGERSGYRKWREMLHAYLTAHDQLYVKVLLWVEELGRRPFKPSDLLDLSEDLDLDAADLIECTNSLYTMLTSYTGVRWRRGSGG